VALLVLLVLLVLLLAMGAGALRMLFATSRR